MGGAGSGADDFIENYFEGPAVSPIGGGNVGAGDVGGVGGLADGGGFSGAEGVVEGGGGVFDGSAVAVVRGLGGVAGLASADECAVVFGGHGVAGSAGDGVWDLLVGPGAEYELDVLGGRAAGAGLGGEIVAVGSVPDSGDAAWEPFAVYPAAEADAGVSAVFTELSARIFPSAVPVVFAGVDGMQRLDRLRSGAERGGCGGWKSNADDQRGGADRGGVYRGAMGESGDAGEERRSEQ